jgi:isorenieratene synthase
VIGGGIAGIAAATVLAEHGASVTLFESGDRLGGRVASWPISGHRTMSRGFHAFFRQYYNLRALLKRTDPTLRHLVPVSDYPLQRPDGLRDSFTSLPRTPPWSVLAFVRQSDSFTLKTLSKVNVKAALELMQVHFPGTYDDYDGEVFARSFFADPSNFAAGELVAMFHTYFMGSAEGLLFDVPNDDYDTCYWGPLEDHLLQLGVGVHVGKPVTALSVDDDGARVTTAHDSYVMDAVVLAADPRAARELLADMTLTPDASGWKAQVAATYNAPPFIVLRLWLGGHVHGDRPAFLGTAGYGPLDNVSVLERFEEGAATWSRTHLGSVVELHAYACAPEVAPDRDAAAAVVAQLEAELHRVYPETETLPVVEREVLVRDDCTLIGPEAWHERPGVASPSHRLVLAGDWVRCDYPVALMERAATTGFMAANELLAGWGVAGEDVWTVPVRGLLRR